MTDTEINIAIAEACGWKAVVSPSNGNHWWAENANGLVYDGGVSEDHCKRVCYPQYTTDLNAMHDAENTLADRWDAYISNLRPIAVGHPDPTMSLIYPQWKCAHATARQRAEAFLRTIGKWKE